MDKLDSENVANAPSPQDTATSEQPKATSDMSFEPDIAPPEKHNYGTHCTCKPDHIPIWKIILEWGAFCLGLTFAWIYYGQWQVMNKQLTEMGKQSTTATESLKLTKQVLEASEVAFIDWKVETISIHAQVVNLAFVNSGHMPAKNIVGSITVKRKSPNGKTLQSTTLPFLRNIIAPNGGLIQEYIGISSDETLDSLLGQDITATGTITFDDGVKRSTQEFCSGMMMVKNGGPHWEDCLNIADRKKYMPGY